MLQKFPEGACGDVSEILGQYLAHRGLGQWLYTAHMRHPSHAWLERDGRILDITADQFNDRPQFAPAQPPVILTRDRSWHERHCPVEHRRRIADMSYYDPGELGDPARRDCALLLQRTRS